MNKPEAWTGATSHCVRSLKLTGYTKIIHWMELTENEDNNVPLFQFEVSLGK